MNLNWQKIDKQIVGEAWVGSNIETHVHELCTNIGPRWATSAADKLAAEYVTNQMNGYGLHNPHIEDFDMETWEHDPAQAWVTNDQRPITILPMLNCPPTDIEAHITDVGFGMPDEIASQGNIAGSIAVMKIDFEPFSNPIAHSARIRSLADAGVAAVVVTDRKSGGRMEYWHSTAKRLASRAGEVQPHPVPSVTTTREDGTYLRECASLGKSLTLKVDSKAYTAKAYNSIGDIPGVNWQDEHIVVGAHHDTVPGSPGGNDNASGTAVLMETARVLATLSRDFNVSPGRAIRFCTWSAEEQNHQGSAAYVREHYGSGTPPRFVINLDELATGPMKGLVLQFPHLRPLMQNTLDTMRDGLQCHVLDHVDPSSDCFSFSRSAIPSAILWRWRFVGRHPDADYHHEPHDTADKVRPRELRNYVSQLARLLLRISHVPPTDWPQNPLTIENVRTRIGKESGTVGRTM